MSQTNTRTDNTHRNSECSAKLVALMSAAVSASVRAMTRPVATEEEVGSDHLKMQLRIHEQFVRISVEVNRLENAF